MNLKSTSCALLGASLLVLAACGNDTTDSRTQQQTPQSRATPPSVISPSATSPDTAPFAAMETMPPECDMSGMDHSTMTPEQQQEMTDDCEAAKRRSSTQQPQSPTPQ